MPSSPPKSQTVMRSIRLTSAEISKLQRDLDQPRQSPPGRRWRERHDLRDRHCVICVHHAGDHSSQPRVVPVRDISTTGMSILHGSYVRPQSDIEIKMMNLRGEVVGFDGTAVHCRYVSQGTHLIGIKFTRPISVALFTESAGMLNGLAYVSQTDPPADFAETLERYRVNWSALDSVREAAEAVAATVPDLILIDTLGLDTETLIESIRAARGVEFHGLLIGLRGDEALEPMLLEAGGDLLLAPEETNATFEALLKGLRAPQLKADRPPPSKDAVAFAIGLQTLTTQANALRTLARTGKLTIDSYSESDLASDLPNCVFPEIRLTAEKIGHACANDASQADLLDLATQLVHLTLRARLFRKY